MRKLGLALCLLLLGLAPAQPQQSVFVPATTASVAVTISTATTTRLITGVSNKSIYLTSISIIADGTGTIQFIAGTGATCGTGTVTLSGAFSLTAQVGFTVGTGYGTVLVVPQNLSLCAVTNAAVGMPGVIAYAIF